MTKKHFPEVEFVRTVNELLEAGASDEIVNRFRAVHHGLIRAAALLIDTYRFPGGKEHALADEALDDLELAVSELHTSAQEDMVRVARRK